MLSASRPLLPHGPAAGLRADNCGNHGRYKCHKALASEYKCGKTVLCAHGTDTAGRQGRIDNLGVHLRCRLSSARGSAETQTPQVPVDLYARQRLRHKVRWVLCAQDLMQAARFGTHKVLHPQLCNCQVPNLAYAATVAYANGG